MGKDEKLDKRAKIFSGVIGVAFLLWVIYDSVFIPIVDKFGRDNIIMQSTDAAVISWDAIMGYSGYGGEYIAIRGEPLSTDDNRMEVIIVNGHPWAIDSSADNYEYSLSDYYSQNGDFVSYGKLVGIFKVSYYADYKPLSSSNSLITLPMPVIKSEYVRGQNQ